MSRRLRLGTQWVGVVEIGRALGLEMGANFCWVGIAVSLRLVATEVTLWLDHLRISMPTERGLAISPVSLQYKLNTEI